MPTEGDEVRGAARREEAVVVTLLQRPPPPVALPLTPPADEDKADADLASAAAARMATSIFRRTKCCSRRGACPV